ncbi:hypothetical protein ACFWR9_29260 [Streptomyces sp. NPDC058534]|uniref:hypothetical protein n=1 Tax=Streptomyces sp. NPDC058534 TaxID=3346541 RepID=UPI0036475245
MLMNVRAALRRPSRRADVDAHAREYRPTSIRMPPPGRRPARRAAPDVAMPMLMDYPAGGSSAYMDEYDLDAVLRASLDRLTLLNQIAGAMSSRLDAVERLGRVCRVLVPALADWCVAELMEDDGHLERVCVSHRDMELLPAGLTGTLPPLPETESAPLARVMRGTGRLLLSADLLNTGREASPGPVYAINRELFAVWEARA